MTTTRCGRLQSRLLRSTATQQRRSCSFKLAEHDVQSSPLSASPPPPPPPPPSPPPPPLPSPSAASAAASAAAREPPTSNAAAAATPAETSSGSSGSRARASARNRKLDLVGQADKTDHDTWSRSEAQAWLNRLNNFAEDRQLDRATRLFNKVRDRLPAGRQTVVWNTQLKAHTLAGDLYGAASHVEEMRRRSIRMTDRTVGKLMHAAATAGNSEQVEYWFRCLHEVVGPPDVTSYTAAMNAFGKAGDPEKARQFFDEMLEAGLLPDGPAWGVLLDAFARSGLPEEAERHFEKMAQSDEKPSEVHYASVIHAWARLGRQDKTKAWLARMEKDGITVSPRVMSIAAQSATETGDVEGSRRWLEETASRGLAASDTQWLASIGAFAKDGDILGARGQIQAMRVAGAKPTVAIYNTLLDICARHADHQQARSVYEEMLAEGLQPDNITFGTMIKCCSRHGDIDAALHWLGHMEEQKLAPDAISYTSVIQCCAKRGDAEQAMQILKRMMDEKLHPDEVAHTAVINAYAKQSQPAAAAGQLAHMLSVGLEPGVVSFSSVLKAYARTGDPASAQSVFEQMLAQKVEPNIISWTSLLEACAKARPKRPREAEHYFRAMLGSGIEADERALKTLSRCGLHGPRLAMLRSLSVQEVQSGLGGRPTRRSFSSSAAGEQPELKETGPRGPRPLVASLSFTLILGCFGTFWWWRKWEEELERDPASASKVPEIFRAGRGIMRQEFSSGDNLEVTAHPAGSAVGPYEFPYSSRNQAPTEWRVLRFRPREGTNTLVQSVTKTTGGRLEPDCLMIPYTKTLAATALTMVEALGLLNENEEIRGRDGVQDCQGSLNGVGKKLRVLCIGLGAGSVPAYLAARLPNCEVQALELEPSVLRAALEMGFEARPGSLDVAIADGAAEALKRSCQKDFEPYDAVLIDAYDANGDVPSSLWRRGGDFVKALEHGLLRSPGFVAINLLPTMDPQDILDNYQTALPDESASSSAFAVRAERTPPLPWYRELYYRVGSCCGLPQEASGNYIAILARGDLATGGCIGAGGVLQRWFPLWALRLRLWSAAESAERNLPQPPPFTFSGLAARGLLSFDGQRHRGP